MIHENVIKSMRFGKLAAAVALLFLVIPQALSCGQTMPSQPSLSEERVLTVPTSIEAGSTRPEFEVLTPTVTGATPTIGQALNIDVEPEPGTVVAEGITLGKTEALVQQAYSFVVSLHPGVTFKPGDLFLFVSGSFTNTSNSALQVSCFATGFNADGKEVAWTVDSGPIMGILAMTIQAGSTGYFTLHLNWDSEVNSVIISAHSYSTATPLP